MYPGQEVEVLGGDEVLVEDIAGEMLGIERRVAGEELEQPLTCELVDRAVAQGNRLGRACPEVRDEAPATNATPGTSRKVAAIVRVDVGAAQSSESKKAT